MRFLLVPAGAAIGALVARGFFLDAIEEVAFRVFWAALGNFHLGVDDVRRLMETQTAHKIALGFVIGGAAGWVAALVVGGRRR